MCLFAIFLFLIGFFYFYCLVIPNIRSDYTGEEIDAVIVITGGKGRIDHALGTFANNKAKLLLISGVGKGFAKKDLQSELNHYNIDSERVILGYAAYDTESNAQEVKTFMLLNGFNSMVLVTTQTHMPRTLMIFKEVMPDYVIMISPFFSASHNVWKTIRIAALEYCKLTITYVMNKIDCWHIAYNQWLQSLPSAY